MPGNPAVISSANRRMSPLSGASFASVDLTGVALVKALAALSADLDLVSSAPSYVQLQRANSRSLVRKVKILLPVLEFFAESLSASPRPLSSSADLCFRELYVLLHRATALLDYCSHSGRLWLIIRNPQLSAQFCDFTQDLSTLLEILPLDDTLGLGLPPDVRDQVELLRRQCRRSKLYIDPHDELLRIRIFSFLESFERGQAPDPADLRATIVDSLGIRDARSCRAEIEFLEELICNQDEGGGADPTLLGGVVALARYSRFLLFGFQDDETDKNRITQGIGDCTAAIPKDFCCPISLELMTDPVVASTGQTYDRASITRWIEEGHRTCPNSGQKLTHSRLVPNLALRSLISQWCAAHGVPYNPPESADAAAWNIASASAGKAAVGANRATAEVLVRQLSEGEDDAKTLAAHELRLMTKNGKENRDCIAEAGAIPLLCRMLCSPNPAAQENAITAILNLSLLNQNKTRIIVQERCLTSVVDVLRHGWTTEARENAAATLFSLSVVHDYKTRIMDEPGAVEALVGLLRDGNPRGQKDAVTALFNLSTHPENCERMLETGAVSALVEALEAEGLAEGAAATLALLVRRPKVAEVVGREDEALRSLVGLMRSGSPKGKENAVAVLHEICRNGGVGLTQKVARTPALGGLIQRILLVGTKRAKRKAASLVRMCHRCEESAVPMMAFGDTWALGYAFASSSSARPSTDVSISVAVPVP